MDIEKKTLSWRISNLVWTILAFCLSNKAYLNLRFRVVFGRWVNWTNPKSFNEKLQWLKLYGYGKKESGLVDKLAVKDFVKERIGEEYIIPTLSVWKDPQEIDIQGLPNSFVLKCNHDSGSIILCKDKQFFDFKAALNILKKSYKKDYYRFGRELPYKFIAKRVFAEELISTEDGQDLKDYKFFCFNGEVKVFKIDFDRFSQHRANYYDTDLNLLPFGEEWAPPDYEREVVFPDNFREMVNIAQKLSAGFPFVRIDLYNNKGRVYFGEITLFPTSGFCTFDSDQWDNQLGEWIDLTVIKKNNA